MLESVLGVYAKNGWHIKAASCEYSLHPALSMLVAGICSVIRGIFVVTSDRGNSFALSFFAPFGDMKYAQQPNALISLCIITSLALVFDRAFLIHSWLGCFGLNKLRVASPAGEML